MQVSPVESRRSLNPLRPPKIRSIRIVENPFDDITPRITAAEKKAQQQARLEAKKDLEIREKRAKAKKSEIPPRSGLTMMTDGQTQKYGTLIV